MKYLKENAVTIILALMALGFSIYENSQSRKHDRYSVTPILNIAVNEVNGFSGLFVSNQGYGPAIIDSGVVMYTMKHFPLSTQTLDSIFCWEYNNEPIDFTIQKHPLLPGHVIRIGEDYLVWGASIAELNGNPKKIEGSLSAISLKVYYHSIYHEQFTKEYNIHSR